jgi:DNA-binding HxlR family transcriptional regulator
LKSRISGRIIDLAIPSALWQKNRTGNKVEIRWLLSDSDLSIQKIRAGGTALVLLSSPLNVHILQALEGESLSPLDLQRAASWPALSTMRVYLRNLIDVGVLEPRRHGTFPPTVEYALTPAGRALLRVGADLQTWLNSAPEGSILLGSPRSKSATRALVEGCSSNIVRALASRPYSLTELSRLNVQTSYPGLERRLSAMRMVNQVEPHPVDGRGTPYRANDWLRRSVVPLAVATAWERKYLPDSSARIGRLDIEAAFLLIAPLVQLPPKLVGRVRLVAEVQGGTTPAHAGAVFEIEAGKVTSWSAQLEGETDASISGTAVGWLRQMNGSSVPHVEFGGDRVLGETVTAGLRTMAGDRSARLARSPE